MAPVSKPVSPKTYTLLTPNGPQASLEPGTMGGYRPKKIFGRLDCPSANRAIAKGGYVQHRVFFKDVDDAQACGYRPCAKCMPEAYAKWKSEQDVKPPAPTARRSFKP